MKKCRCIKDYYSSFTFDNEYEFEICDCERCRNSHKKVNFVMFNTQRIEFRFDKFYEFFEIIDDEIEWEDITDEFEM